MSGTKGLGQGGGISPPIAGATEFETPPPPDRAALLALRDRVRGLTGLAREVDVEIAEALGHKITWLARDDIRNANGGPVIHWQAPHPYAGMREPCPPWTASLDAVVALIERVLPGQDWEVSGSNYANIYSLPFNGIVARLPRMKAPTPALALLLALIEALLSQEQETVG